MARNRHIQRYDGEGWTVHSRTPFNISCCHCGLTHTLVLIAGPKGKPIGIAAKQEPRSTGQLRRHRKYKCQPTKEDG